MESDRIISVSQSKLCRALNHILRPFKDLSQSREKVTSLHKRLQDHFKLSTSFLEVINLKLIPNGNNLASHKTLWSGDRKTLSQLHWLLTTKKNHPILRNRWLFSVKIRRIKEFHKLPEAGTKFQIKQTRIESTKFACCNVQNFSNGWFLPWEWFQRVTSRWITPCSRNSFHRCPPQSKHGEKQI